MNVRLNQKPAGIYDLMGIALGCVGLSYDDFCRLDYDEFEAVVKTWHDNREATERGAWERIRVLAAVVIQPHVKRRITPRQLMPLPWDDEKKKNRLKQPELSAEDRRKRFERLVGR